MNNQREHHMRCYECGNRVTDGEQECPTCHAALWALGSSTVNAPTPLMVTAQGDSAVAVANHERQDVTVQPLRGQMILQRSESAVASAAAANQSALAHVIPTKSSVRGRVIIADSPCSEDPDLDVCKIITRILWIIMLLPLLIGAAGVCLLFRCSSAINMFAMLGAFRFLNPVPRDNVQVPVRYFRIREDGSDAEVMVRVKGNLASGNIGLEDLVTLSGRSRGGTLFAREGYNHRTASTIRLAKSYSWVGLVLTILFILALVVTFHEPTAKVARTVSALEGAQ